MQAPSSDPQTHRLSLVARAIALFSLHTVVGLALFGAVAAVSVAIIVFEDTIGLPHYLAVSLRLLGYFVLIIDILSFLFFFTIKTIRLILDTANMWPR
jgi:hypothetical protein